MPVRLPRRAVALLVCGLLAALPSACKEQPTGALKVLVIGDQPKLTDPYRGALKTGDAVLLDSLAQGLVRFDAGGNIVAGIAERWNVTDDGLSYIFRIGSVQWADGRKVTAQQVARALKRNLARRSKNPLADTLGAVEDIVAMTDRVIEIRLISPRPNLLALLAQPEFAVLRGGAIGTGPFTLVDPAKSEPQMLRLRRDVVSTDDEVTAREEVLLGGADARPAIAAFRSGRAHLVLGGTFDDLPFVRAVKLPRASLRFDPASGLFGLVPARAGGELDDPELRQLLSEAVNREALLAAFNVPGLAARATVLEPGLDGVQVTQPAWFATPLAERLTGLQGRARAQFPPGKNGEKPLVRVDLPAGPGGDVLLSRLQADWGALGLTVERAPSPAAADFRLVDAVAPSSSPAWFLRSFRCGAVPVCVTEADALMDAARTTLMPAERYNLLMQAAGQIEGAQLFIPLAAPIRWLLVAPRVQGFAGNRYARHTLSGLEPNSRSGAQ